MRKEKKIFNLVKTGKRVLLLSQHFIQRQLQQAMSYLKETNTSEKTCHINFLNLNRCD